MRGPTVIVCAEIADPEWNWLQGALAGTDVKFVIVRCAARTGTKVTPFGWARLSGSFAAVRIARRSGAQAIVAHGPTLAAWCAIFCRTLGLKIPILAHSFNFTALPSALKRRVFIWALSRIDRFVVFSTVERTIYARTFALPADKFDVVLWGVRPPKVCFPQTALEDGKYICAVGGNARDYRSLLEAARRLPFLKFVLVVRPASLKGMEIPRNVVVRINLSYGKAMNIVMHSQFMVLPLVNSDVPCGHVTLVAAMHLGKALIITDSAGISDYVRSDQNALTVAAGSIDSLTNAITHLWNDSVLCARLGETGRYFASRECTEQRIAEHFQGWLVSRGLSEGSVASPVAADGQP